MKKRRLVLFGFLAGFSALAVSSCVYDPYYTSTSYSTGYGYGSGYGSSNFSTSFFVSTGNPRWAYDPYAGCYYDYTRRCYYDPHLYGYYPIGYRPRYVVGAPHPHGWYRGRNYCPPPTVVRNHTIVDYSNRAQSYRSLGRDWSRNVGVSAPTNQPRPGFGGRDYHDRGYDSRGSGAPQRQERVPSRGGSIQRGGEEGGRGFPGRVEAGRDGFGRPDPRQSVTQPAFPVNRGENRGGGSAGSSPERQARQEFERPAAPPRMERPAPPRESSPGNFGRGGTYRSEQSRPGGGSPGRAGGGIRSLGEG